MIREFNKTDLAWIRPIAEKYGSWEDCQKFANDPDGFGLVCAYVIAPYAVGIIVEDVHGALMEGLTDTYGIKHLIRLADFLVGLADLAEIDLHNHKFNERPWFQGMRDRLGFVETVPEVGHIRYYIKPAVQEVA